MAGKRRSAIWVISAGLCLVCASDRWSAQGQAVGADSSLFGRTAAQVLERAETSPDVSYLLLDLRSREVIAKRWESSKRAIPVGSLVKPFTALAYAEGHGFRFPEFTCSPGACWYPQGHGKLGIVRAVAFSCNAYFIHLGSEVRATQVASVAQRFGLAGPPLDSSGDVLAGRYGMWRESPEALARAYAQLLASRDQPGVREIAEGMGLSANSGTALGVAREAPHVAALGKTGTAPCTHERHAPGDGFVVVAWPADSPQHLLLVRYHGHPGSQAAVVAGKMLRKLEP